jgi:hypothetical protein
VFQKSPKASYFIYLYLIHSRLSSVQDNSRQVLSQLQTKISESQTKIGSKYFYFALIRIVFKMAEITVG